MTATLDEITIEIDTPDSKAVELAKSAAYNAATRQLRREFEPRFTELLQLEYDKRDLGKAPLGPVAKKAEKERLRRQELRASLDKKRAELEALEAEALEAGLT
jgi:hypothetical protein